MSTRTPYDHAHRRVAYYRGRASSHICEHCGEPAHDWALDHRGEDPQRVYDLDKRMYYSNDRSRYMALCVSCHKRFDYAASRPNCPQGHPYQGDNLLIERGKRKCRACRNAKQNRQYKTKMQDPEFRARKNAYSRAWKARARELERQLRTAA